MRLYVWGLFISIAFIMSETTSLSAYDALRKIADELSVLVREQGSSLKFEVKDN